MPANHVSRFVRNAAVKNGTFPDERRSDHQCRWLAFGEFMSDRNVRSAADQENKPVVPQTKASQGTKGHNVRYVLLAGTVGAVIALALAYFAFFPN
jgi:hypothetical protein